MDISTQLVYLHLDHWLRRLLYATTESQWGLEAVSD